MEVGGKAGEEGGVEVNRKAEEEGGRGAWK